MSIQNLNVFGKHKFRVAVIVNAIPRRNKSEALRTRSVPTQKRVFFCFAYFRFLHEMYGAYRRDTGLASQYPRGRLRASPRWFSFGLGQGVVMCYGQLGRCRVAVEKNKSDSDCKGKRLNLIFGSHRYFLGYFSMLVLNVTSLLWVVGVDCWLSVDVICFCHVRPALVCH